MVTNIIGFKIYFFTIDVVLRKQAKRPLTVSFQVLVFFFSLMFLCFCSCWLAFFAVFVCYANDFSTKKETAQKVLINGHTWNTISSVPHVLLQVFISTECLGAEVTIENGWVGVVASADVLLHAVLQFETFAAVFTLEGEVRIRLLRSRWI